MSPKRSGKKRKKHDKALLAFGVVGAGAVVGALLLSRNASGSPPPVPTGSTFLGVASQSGNDTLSIQVSINGTVVIVDDGVGGGYTLAFDGVSSYTLTVPQTVGASTFQFWYLVGGPNSGQQVPGLTLAVPAGAYTAAGSQIIAYYS